MEVSEVDILHKGNTLEVLTWENIFPLSDYARLSSSVKDNELKKKKLSTKIPQR